MAMEDNRRAQAGAPQQAEYVEMTDRRGRKRKMRAKRHKKAPCARLEAFVKECCAGGAAEEIIAQAHEGDCPFDKRCSAARECPLATQLARPKDWSWLWAKQNVSTDLPKKAMVTGVRATDRFIFAVNDPVW